MCRFLAFRATDPTALHCCLTRAGNALLAQSVRDMDGFSHADGWGVARYRDGEMTVIRHPAAAHQGEDFERAAREATATAALAHVRRATVGANTLENTHPFVHGAWTFVHNGTIPHFEEIRPAMLAAMGERHRAAVLGETDSEHAFHLILALYEADPERPLLDVLVLGLRHIVAWCRAFGSEPHLGLNLLLTDGVRMVGSRWRRSLAYRLQSGAAVCAVCGLRHAETADPGRYRSVTVASEPITSDGWQPVPERSAYAVTDDFRLAIRPIEAADAAAALAHP